MELLNEKSINSVTVKEICELADVNRSTFYTHYTDQYHLLEQIESELIQDMERYLNSFNFEVEEETMEMTEKLLEYLASKSEECKTLLNEHTDSTFQHKVTAVAHRFIMHEGLAARKIDPKVSEYIGSFIVNGSINMMKLWLYRGMDRSPKEMSGMIHTFINKGLEGLS